MPTGSPPAKPSSRPAPDYRLAGEATWVEAGIPHRFLNRGDGPLRIYWVYGGRDVTRTITATGETVEHLSENDRGGLTTTGSP